MSAISIQNLSFSYPKQENYTLSSIDMEIEEGERFGLFGPNGAGKTTLISLMTGLLQSTSGKIKLLNQPIDHKDKTKKLFGFIPQDFAFYGELSPVENLQFFGAWSGLDPKKTKQRTDELLQILGLTEHRNIQVKKFSGGMKRRVNLAIGVIHNPKILFLDEPTVGVDVQTRHAIIDYLKKLNAEGTTLIYTSHLLQEAEDLCNHVALIDEGKIIAMDTIENLKSIHNEPGLEALFLKLTGKAYRD